MNRGAYYAPGVGEDIEKIDKRGRAFIWHLRADTSEAETKLSPLNPQSKLKHTFKTWLFESGLNLTESFPLFPKTQ